ncbi:hypothetical protein HY490_03175 [Candidatus Woesearchaeota archaeon]|nr:hypothetical protein [Candidatus Woesearchaeota archaeon]
MRATFVVLMVLLALPVLSSISDYPNFFRSGEPVIVVGDNAPASDVVAAINIAQAMVNLGVISTPDRTRLASEIGDIAQLNAVVIGSPCHNPVTDQLLGHPVPCDEAIPEGKGLVKLVQFSSGKSALIVAARSEQTRELAKIVRTWTRNNLVGAEHSYGNEVIVSLSPAPSKPRVKNIPLPPPVFAENSVTDMIRVDERKEYKLQERSKGVQDQADEVRVICAGCQTSQGCLPIGMRAVVNEPSYCDTDGVMRPQKVIDVSCQNNHECASNSCLGGSCRDIDQRFEQIENELKEQKSLLQRVLDFLSNLFQ